MSDEKPHTIVDVLDDSGNVVARGLANWTRPSPLGEIVDVACNGRRMTTLTSRTRSVEQRPRLRRAK